MTDSEQNTISLPDYVTVDIAHHIEPEVLRAIAKAFTFPLTDEDKRDIDILDQKFMISENVAGLAAPQIGISKRVIVFAADGPELKKFRKDFTQEMPKSIWLNPTYANITENKTSDGEACFSVAGYAGDVPRFNKIKYEYCDFEGNKIEGTAEGYLARVIQHEVDHLNGKLFTDLLKPEELYTIEEYRERRRKQVEKEQL